MKRKKSAIKRIARKIRVAKQLAKVRRDFARWLIREAYLTNHWQ